MGMGGIENRGTLRNLAYQHAKISAITNKRVKGE